MTVATSTSKSGPYAGAGTTGPFTVGFRFLATDHLQVVQTDEDGVETVLVLDTDYTVAGVGAGSGSVTLLAALPVGETLTITRDVPFTQEADYVANDAFPAESHERALDLLTMQTQQLNEQVQRSAKLPVSSTADADALVADIVLLADNLATLETVAGGINDIQAVAAIDDDVSVAAANVADITNFADVYLGPSASDPTLRADGSALQIGDLYFNTGTSLIRVYSSLGWVDAQTPTPVTITRQQFSGDGSETDFTLSSAPAFLNALFVEISGVSQVPSVDYTLSGTTLTFTSAPPLGTNNILARWFSPIAAGVPNDGSVTTDKLADDAVTTDKIDDEAVTHDKLAADVTLILTGKNLLINGNFSVNQRGYVSGAATGGANQYTLDRWRVVTSGQNLAFSASGNGYEVTAPAGGLEQVVEGINVEGGTYVLNWTGTATATVGGVARTKGETFTLTANTNVTVRFTGGTVSLAQLELGTVVTPFERRHYTVERALCQRYFYTATVLVTAAVNGSVYWGSKVTMRTTPTIAGGGSGFSTSAASAEGANVFQTTQAVQTLTATAEL